MKNTVLAVAALACLIMGSLAHAGSEVTPGNYRTAPAYYDVSGGLEPGANACIYILGAPVPPLGTFQTQIVFGPGNIYDMQCTRLSKGSVKAGKDPKVKEDKSKLVVCVGEESTFEYNISLIFQLAGSGSKARLKKPQVVFDHVADTNPDDGANVVMADAVLDTTACPSPAPVSAPAGASGTAGALTGG